MVPSFNKAEVKEILSEYSRNGLTHGQNFYNCLARAEADYISQYGHDPMLLSRAKASVRNSKILHYVRQLMLEDTHNYVYVEDANSFYVRVAGRLHARFKKLDDQGRSSSGKTQRDTDYRLQKGECLPFLSEVRICTNLDIGYTLDATGSLSAISFSCCAPKGVHWKILAKDLQIVEAQVPLFAPTEQEVLPVLQLDVKEHLKKRSDERKTGSAI